MHTAKFFGTVFLYRTTLVANSEVSFSMRKVNGDIAFALISLPHVQIQEPCKQVTYFEGICLSCKIYCHKIFETRSQWWLKRLHVWT